MIRISLFDDMSFCTDAEVERMIPLVPEPRRSQALAFKANHPSITIYKRWCLTVERLVMEHWKLSVTVQVIVNQSNLNTSPHRHSEDMPTPKE